MSEHSCLCETSVETVHPPKLSYYHATPYFIYLNSVYTVWDATKNVVTER